MLARSLTAISSALPSSIKYRLGWMRGAYSAALKFGQSIQRITTLHNHSFNWEVDSLSSQEHLRGGYEPYMQDAFERYVRPGMIVLDIGAHNGFHSLLLASMGANVIAIEPNPINRESLLRQVAVNPALKISALPYALGDTEGMAQFTFNGAMSHLSDNGERVEVRTLDSLGLSPDVIKIDVEGFESQVLRGGMKSLEQDRPVILSDYDSPETIPSLTKLLSSLGYSVIGGPPVTCISDL